MDASANAATFTHALVRRPARSVTGGLRAKDIGDPTYDGVAAEHRAYVAALAAAGLCVEVLPALEAFPDSVFVEDPALVFGEGAILLDPGADSRRGEAVALRPVLDRRFHVVLDLGQGRAEGGDVLVTPGEVMIGLSDRTDRTGAEALAARLAELGRRGRIVEPPPGVLHFKTACSLIDDETVLATPALAAGGAFDGMRVLLTPDGEEAAANALRVNDVVLAGAAFPRTIEMLEREGCRVVPLDVSQIGRIDAGLSCMSLRWREPQ
jgi:dimethylargininase